MKIAVVTPWPEDKTGIAAYAYDLVNGLMQSESDVCVFTQVNTPKLLKKCVINTSPWTEWDLAPYEMIVYQMGNNSDYHGYMLDLIKMFPGVIHLHDVILHHLIVGIEDKKNNSLVDYFNLVEKRYGIEKRQEIEQSALAGDYIWETEAVVNFPFFEEAVSYATGVITHSKFARDAIRKVFPNLPIKILPQVYDLKTIGSPSEKDGIFRIGLLGGVQPNKRLDLVFKALLRKELCDVTIQVDIVGTGACETNPLLATFIQLLPENIHVQCHGYMSEQAFDELFQSLDLCVALRYPTMGETSAIVMKSLQLGIPVVVSNVGWYAELPDFIPKVVMDEKSEENCYDILSELILDRAAYHAIQRGILRWSGKELQYTITCEKYYESLHYFIFYASQEWSEADDYIFHSLARSMFDVGLDSDDQKNVRENIYYKLGLMLCD